MTSAAPPPLALPPQPSAWEMYRSMVGVGLVCGLLIVTAFVLTGPIIQRNRAEALQRAIFHVLPEARTTRTFRYADGRFAPVAQPAAGDEIVYGAYDEQGRLAGVAVEAQGLGYQDTIRVLYGYAPTRNAIVGIEVLELRDTPGLGDRVESDPDFLRNFERLDVTLAPDGQQLAHPIEKVKHGAATEPWQIDTITGATITSSAVATMIARSAAVWVPRIAGDLAAMEAPQ